MFPRYESTTYADGTRVVCERPGGWITSAVVVCSDGKVRNATRLNASLDFRYAAECYVRIQGKYVAGHILIERKHGNAAPESHNNPRVAKFVARGKNAGLLPAGVWTPPFQPKRVRLDRTFKRDRKGIAGHALFVYHDDGRAVRFEFDHDDDFVYVYASVWQYKREGSTYRPVRRIPRRKLATN